MEALRIASICLVALFMPTLGANALEPTKPPLTTKDSLVQKIQPVSRSYPGVSADILGIRTGMTVSEAEAMAGKSYNGNYKPEVEQVSDTLAYDPRLKVESHPFIYYIRFNRSTPIAFDQLQLYFSSPATGNTVLGMSRQVSYDANDYRAQQKVPLVSTVKALLIKKYGPTSYQSTSQDGGLAFAWVFGQKKPVTCKTPDCVSADVPGVARDFSSDDALNNFQRDCGTTARFPDSFRIHAKIDTNGKDQVRDLTISIWDAAACVNDAKEAKTQLTAAAIEYYKTTH